MGYDYAGQEDKSMDAARQGKAIVDRLLQLEPNNPKWKAGQSYFDKHIAFLIQHGQK
jgi:hypothetical protein